MWLGLGVIFTSGLSQLKKYVIQRYLSIGTIRFLPTVAESVKGLAHAVRVTCFLLSNGKQMYSSTHTQHWC